MKLISINLLIEESKMSGAAELANAQLFICKLCEALELPPPDFARERDCENHYVFEKSVSFGSLNGRSRTGRIDLYKRGCFVLESKQSALTRGDLAGQAETAPMGATIRRNRRSGAVRRGTGAWRRAMTAARMQAEHYARALPEPPPFLIIVDVGYVMEIYADFSGRGSNYAPFPHPGGHHIAIDDLRRPQIQERLRALWTNPHSLAGEMHPDAGHGDDTLNHYLLDRAASRQRGSARTSQETVALFNLSGSRFAPCLGLRERGAACQILV